MSVYIPKLVQCVHFLTACDIWLIQARNRLETGDVKALLDPKLKGHHDIPQMRRMSLAANLCTNQSAHLRPNMSQVLKLLRGETDASELDYEDEDNHFLEAGSSMSHSVSDSMSSSSYTDTASSAGKTPRFKLKDYLTTPDPHFEGIPNF